MLDVKAFAAAMPYPRSFLGLLLTGFTLVMVPLVGALAYSAWNTERLAAQSRTAVFTASQAARASRSLVDRIAAIERAAQQLTVLNDPRLLRLEEQARPIYARLARSFALLLLPLLALPLGLSAKRGGRAPGIIIAALLLLAFQHMIGLGQSLASSGRANPATAVGLPFVIFAILCIGTFFTSRKRPGETPIGLFAERVGDFIRSLLRLRRGTAAEATT